ncbi:MAG: hypothetical protein EOO20_17550, partial [Chryseobacterium sp.]
MIHRQALSVENLFRISELEHFQICSHIGSDPHLSEYLKGIEIEFQRAYKHARQHGYALIYFADPLDSARKMPTAPRFSEADFHRLISEAGGIKIPETARKTPDFLFGDIVLELKDIQKENLYNQEKQKSIAKIFKDHPD